MNTLFEKMWDAHVVQKVEDGPAQLYIDRLCCHEVTSPQAFSGLRERGIKCLDVYKRQKWDCSKQSPCSENRPDDSANRGINYLRRTFPHG